MRAIDHIAAGYSSLKDRTALEDIRDHRKRLLNDYRMRSGLGLTLDRITDRIREEIGVVEDAISRLSPLADTSDDNVKEAIGSRQS